MLKCTMQSLFWIESFLRYPVILLLGMVAWWQLHNEPEPKIRTWNH